MVNRLKCWRQSPKRSLQQPGTAGLFFSWLWFWAIWRKYQSQCYCKLKISLGRWQAVIDKQRQTGNRLRKNPDKP
jgi:hypothetical protein